MNWISKIFDIHKLPFKIIFWFVIVSGVLLFSPPGFIERLKLSGFMFSYGKYIGVIFLASGALIAINTIGWIWLKVKGRAGYWKWKSSLENVLNNLDHSEKAVLREFYIQGKHTIELPMDNPTVVGLRNKGIVYIAGKYGQHTLAGLLIPFAISDEAREFINSDMLDLPIGEPNEQEIQRIRDSRPDFVREIERRKALLRW